MNRLTQAQYKGKANYSGNQGNNNIIGSNNTIHINTLGGTAGHGGAMLRVGEGALNPHRLIPYARNRSFTGRENLIQTIKRFCERLGHNRVALYGLGGSGKTQIALEYIYQRANESNCHVFWVQGSGELKFGEGFRAVAQLVRIPTLSSEADHESILQGVRSWFEGPSSGDWILVIDNIDNKADFTVNNSPIAKFIPQSAKGTVIFTTRSRQVACRLSCEMIEVGKMCEEEAEELFLKRSGRSDSLRDDGGKGKAVAKVLGSVDHLPLAVVGSAAFMTETETPPSRYWTILQENEDRMRELHLQGVSDIQRELDVPESILSTFFVTPNRIMQRVPPAADLRLMSFSDRRNMPEELLSQSGLEGIDHSIDFHQIMGELAGFSLVAIVKYEDKTLYELHRLNKLSLQVCLPTEDLSHWGAIALRVISRLFPRSLNDQWSIGPAYVPQALEVIKDLTDPIAEELSFCIGLYFLDMGSYNNAEIQVGQSITLREECKVYDWDDEGDERFMLQTLTNAHQGKYSESEDINRRVIVGCGEVLGPDNPYTLASLRNLAAVLGDLGRYDESEAINRRVLEGYTKALGPDHPDTLRSLNDLAIVLCDQGKYHESEAMHRRALEGYTKALGPDHPETLRSLNDLATVLSNQGKYDESEAMYRLGLGMCEKILGPDHPDTLINLNDLASLLCDQGKYDESEAMHRRVLEGSEKVLGLDHPDTLITLRNLATALRKQGKYNESGAMSQRVLEGHEMILGPDHPSTLTSLSNLATVLRDQGKYDESEAMNRRVLEGYEKFLGPDHPDTLVSLNNLARVLRDQGKYDESEATNRRALEGSTKVLGPDHPDTLVILNNLATVLASQGKYDESEAMHRRVLEGSEKVLGLDHPNTLATLGNLATVLCDLGKYDESEAMHRRELEVYEKTLGPDHPSTLISLGNLATVLCNQGKHNESEAVSRHVLEGNEKVLGPNHPNTLASLNNLALVLRDQGKSDESEAMNQCALEGYTKVLGPDHPDTLVTLNNLATGQRNRGK